MRRGAVGKPSEMKPSEITPSEMPAALEGLEWRAAVVADAWRQGWRMHAVVTIMDE